MPRRYLSLALFSISSLIVLCGGAADPPWEPVRDTSDGIAVYARETAGSTVRAVKATCTVAAPPEVVLDAAADPDTFRTSTKYVSVNRLQRTKDPNVWYIYQLVSYPVVAPRDYALRYERQMDKAKGVYRLVWSATTAYGPAPLQGVVRVTLADGAIAVKPLPGGKLVAVTYHLVADPGGSIPGWVMRIAQRFNLPEIVRELRDESLRRAGNRS